MAICPTPCRQHGREVVAPVDMSVFVIFWVLIVLASNAVLVAVEPVWIAGWPATPCMRVFNSQNRSRASFWNDSEEKQHTHKGADDYGSSAKFHYW
jgi:hypothetical protein